MLNGELYDGNYNQELLQERIACKDLCFEYNRTKPSDSKKRKQLIKQILAHLTPLQKQIAKMLALGNSQRQIATKLNRAVSTINEHINNIRKIANKIKN